MGDDPRDIYIADIERQNEELRSSVEKYALLVGAAYQIYVVDETMNKLCFQKIIDYYCSFGWVLHHKRLTAEHKRRWEYFSLPEDKRRKIRIGEANITLNSPFLFPYKPVGKTMFQKYKMQTVEAMNKFNIMLIVHSKLENKLPLEVYDFWVNNFGEK